MRRSIVVLPNIQSRRLLPDFNFLMIINNIEIVVAKIAAREPLINSAIPKNVSNNRAPILYGFFFNLKKKGIDTITPIAMYPPIIARLTKLKSSEMDIFMADSILNTAYQEDIVSIARVRE